MTSRRSVLTGALAAGVAAASAGRVKAAAHPTPGVEFAFEAIVELGPLQVPGPTPYGERTRVPITGGHFEGPKIKGKVLSGGADWQLHRKDGCMTLEADYLIQADDGALIHVFNRGVAWGAMGAADSYLRTTPVFEAPIGPHDWLNKAVFVGTVELVGSNAVCIRVFKVI